MMQCKYLVLLLVLLLAAGCVDDDSAGDRGTTGAVSAAGLAPSEEIPGMHPLLNWAELRLGMSSFDISQIYNAPEGRGDGFTRALQHFGSSVNHVINFEHVDGEPTRAITCALYRDKLFMVVDRRDGLNSEQTAAWFTECEEQFGTEHKEQLSGAQWVWCDSESITAIFTQDNAAEEYMSATLVIEHHPTSVAWHEYNAAWDALQEDDS